VNATGSRPPIVVGDEGRGSPDASGPDCSPTSPT
jgi:hypothetical protein